MTITAAIVLFAMTWFLVFFCILPIGHRSQADVGEIAPGTPASAPAVSSVARKAKWTTLITFIVWAGIFAFISSGWLTIDDLGWTTDLIVEPPPAGN